MKFQQIIDYLHPYIILRILFTNNILIMWQPRKRALVLVSGLGGGGSVVPKG